MPKPKQNQIYIRFKWFNPCCFYFKGPSTHIKRATTEKLREIFLKYASFQENGEFYMTNEDFIRGYLRLFPESNYNKVKKKL